MNIKDIKALASVLQQADLTALEYSEGDLHIRLERAVIKAHDAAVQTVCDQAVEPVLNPAEEKNDFNNLNEVKAPMVGVFYAAPAPDAPPFVKVGDSVEKGQVICLIEAMKLMNDITAPVSGRIVDICAQDGAVLEYGQTIMKIV
ncbi:MAG TPA: acetyl-CoA carboxylase biotin carboxyl carrier protein [Candidatus Limiplasma sp.]|nr:acetyl-CoA carboxylase biotin carboxyl carrier protein [Candidatus Limiplasma sp.]HPS80950.1 acetyl-CoA carboxylase biotin carboxyl carrier protein [Candidatus Limiplasma sp.]